MTKKRRLELLLSVLLGAILAPAPVPAQDRLSAYQLQCFVPTTPGYHTRATAWGKITAAQRSQYWVVSCQDGPAPAQWPVVAWSDGEVQTLDATLVVVLEDAQHRVLAYNYCTYGAYNGYLTGRCLAHETQGGEVNLLVSIPPMP
jgi:hypothetical protein